MKLLLSGLTYNWKDVFTFTLRRVSRREKNKNPAKITLATAGRGASECKPRECIELSSSPIQKKKTMSYQGNPSYPPQQPVPQGTYALPPPGYQQQAPPFSGYPNSTGAGTYASAPPVYTNGPPAGYPGGPHVGYPGGPPAEYPGGPHPGYPSYPQPGAPPTSTVVVIDQGIPLCVPHKICLAAVGKALNSRFTILHTHNHI